METYLWKTYLMPAQSDELEVSIVMPCLNEVGTLGTCIGKAQKAMRDHGLKGEIIIADNGSTDGSVELAQRLGARVVPVADRGYGNALQGGIAAAHGSLIIMGDADDSYDFSEIPTFVKELRKGFDLIQGCRLPSGGGTVMPGAMPFLHRWLGNPMFSFMARRMFRAPVSDIYCGLRGFRRTAYDRLGLRCPGMEFAAEMIIKSSLQGLKIGEVPITLHPDGRVSHPSHLRTFRDGWRTLRLLLLCCPRWLFLYPGLALIIAGLVGYGVALPGLTIAGATFDAHTLLVGSLSFLVGYQAIFFYLVARIFASREGYVPATRTALPAWFAAFTLERSLLFAAAVLLFGIGLLIYAANFWRLRDFGPLDYAVTMRWVIPAVTSIMWGFLTMLNGFLLTLLNARGHS